ncbi:MAG: hypothetical protein ABJA67_00510 [Chthonomonadales bacterium]
MNRFQSGSLALSLLTLAAYSSNANAQDAPPLTPPAVANFATGQGGLLLGLGGGTIRSKAQMLLARAEVQLNIHLTLRQKNELTEFLDPNRPQMIKVVAEHGNAPQIVQGFGEGMDPKIEEVLKPEQKSRLLQIDLQYRGLLALSDPKVAEKLKLSAETRESIKAIAEKFSGIVREAMRSAITSDQSENPSDGNVIRRIKVDSSKLESPQSPERRTVKAAKDEAEKKIGSLLTSEQKAEWKKAQGDDFTFVSDAKFDWKRIFLM